MCLHDRGENLSLFIQGREYRSVKTAIYVPALVAREGAFARTLKPGVHMGQQLDVTGICNAASPTLSLRYRLRSVLRKKIGAKRSLSGLQPPAQQVAVTRSIPDYP